LTTTVPGRRRSRTPGGIQDVPDVTVIAQAQRQDAAGGDEIDDRGVNGMRDVCHRFQRLRAPGPHVEVETTVPYRLGHGGTLVSQADEADGRALLFGAAHCAHLPDRIMYMEI
jgi:hypothetical protein